MRGPTSPARVPILVLAAAAAAAIGGCGGGGTKTVSVSSSPPTTQSSTSTTTTTPPPTSTSGTSSSSSSSTGGTSSSTAATTRTAPAPAFAEHEKSSASTTAEGLEAAQAVVRAQGYAVKDTSDYHPDQTLRVLIGTNAGSGDGYDQRAFFFVDGRYIGTDSKQPSAQVSVSSQSDTEVTLAYALYKPGNPLCCPAGGQATVHFQLNNGQLQPLEEIPPVNSTTGPSRQ
jgi:hypothetical protein